MSEFHSPRVAEAAAVYRMIGMKRINSSSRVATQTTMGLYTRPSLWPWLEYH